MGDRQLITMQYGDIVQAIAARSDLARSTRERYAGEITRALIAGVDLMDAEQAQVYARGLSETGRRFLRAGLAAWAKQVELQAKGSANPANVSAVQAVIYRLEAMQEAIPVHQARGEKLHNWLSIDEVQALLETCDRATVRGTRDRLALGLLVCAGLRREEAARLTFEQIETRAAGENKRTVLQIVGKGAKMRAVPISYRLAAGIDEWACNLDERAGFVLRRINKGGRIGANLTPRGIFRIVREHGEEIGRPTLAAHDLRRTFARLAWECGVPVLELAKLLGHTDPQVTQLYINAQTNLTDTASDYIPF